MKIAYFTPLLPDASGISDFAEELLPELSKYVDIDLFCRIPPTSDEIIKNFTIYTLNDIENEEIRNQYDVLVYQAGNNERFHGEIMKKFMKYPGVLEIHDFALHHLLAETTYAKGKNDEYIRIMEYCHGEMGRKAAEDFLQGRILAPWDHQSFKYTVNKHYVDRAQAVIVHSDMAKQMILAIRPDVKICNIPLHTPTIVEDVDKFKQQCREKIGLGTEKMVLGSFGYATKAKRILEILDALAFLKEKKDFSFVYYIVGKVDDQDIIKRISNLGLKKDVVVTGYVGIKDFVNYMGACDICFNLRYPTQGESSASLHRIIGMGKPVLVTDIGAFEEYPDDIVYKISHDENEMWSIVRTLEVITADEIKLYDIANRCVSYAREKFSLKKNTQLYYQFFKSVCLGKEMFEEQIDNVLNDLFSHYPEKNVTVDLVLNHYNIT